MRLVETCGTHLFRQVLQGRGPMTAYNALSRAQSVPEPDLVFEPATKSRGMNYNDFPAERTTANTAAFSPEGSFDQASITSRNPASNAPDFAPAFCETCLFPVGFGISDGGSSPPTPSMQPTASGGISWISAEFPLLWFPLDYPKLRQLSRVAAPDFALPCLSETLPPDRRRTLSEVGTRFTR